jgi:hypothetical protein
LSISEDPEAAAFFPISQEANTATALIVRQRGKIFLRKLIRARRISSARAKRLLREAAARSAELLLFALG